MRLRGNKNWQPGDEPLFYFFRSSVQMTTTTIKIIKPHSERSVADELAAVWAHRELLMVLVRREISIRYRQAVIGLLWVVLQPLITTAIFTTVFVVFVRIPNQEESYPLFAFAGLAVWQYFNRVVVEGSASLIANSALITKVSFPRLIIPLVPPLAAALDCSIAIAVLTVAALVLGASVSWTVISAPLVILAVALFGYAVALWVAPLNAVYRDIGIALPVVMQVAMYMSPIVYPSSLVPERIRWLFELNPIAVMVNAMRWVVLGTNAPSPAGIAIFAILTALLFWGGSRVFRQMEGNLVDRI
jgi:homopolymeric O-antigen transport system permease protein